MFICLHSSLLVSLKNSVGDIKVSLGFGPAPRNSFGKGHQSQHWPDRNRLQRVALQGCRSRLSVLSLARSNGCRGVGPCWHVARPSLCTRRQSPSSTKGRANKRAPGGNSHQTPHPPASRDPHILGVPSLPGRFSRRLPAKPRKGAVLHADKACSDMPATLQTCDQRGLEDRRRAGICARCHAASESENVQHPLAIR